MKYRVKHTATLFETVMEIYKGTSKQKAKQIIGHSDFLLNGERIARHPKKILEAGDELEINPAAKERHENQVPSRRTPVAIYFEDQYLIIARKPAGILSCGNGDRIINNSYHKLLEKFLSGRDNKKTKLWIIHRLDREVEGLLMFAKTEKVQLQMKSNWLQVTKKYLALTEKKPEPASGIIESWLKDTSKQKVISYPTKTPDGKFAKTEYTYLRTDKSHYLLEVLLHTGRKNQIRVHLASINCPIVGDRKYGANASVIRQIRLSANVLEFKHPETDKTVTVSYMPTKRFFSPTENENEKYKII